MRPSLPALVAVALAFASCESVPDGSDGERPLQVGFLLLDGVYNSELAPFDVFHHTVFHHSEGMRVFTVGRDMDVVTSFEGLRFLPDRDLTDPRPIDVLVVPSAAQRSGAR